MIDENTGTKFDEITEEDGRRFKCLGVGVRKLMAAKVYALAFCIEAAQADSLVKSYLDAQHAGLEGRTLVQALGEDQAFFDMLAGAGHDRLVVLRMLRDLSRRQLATNIRRSLGPLLSEEKLDRLDAAVTKGAKKGQLVKIYTVATRLTVDVAGEVRALEDEQVARTLFLVWLGTNSVSPSLREDIARRAVQLR